MTRITLEIDDEVRKAMTKGCFLANACGTDFGILFDVAIKILHGLDEKRDTIQLKYKSTADRERDYDESHS